jgi:hypothetical protein
MGVEELLDEIGVARFSAVGTKGGAFFRSLNVE